MTTLQCQSVVSGAGAIAWQRPGVLAAILLIGGCVWGQTTAPAQTVTAQTAPALSEPAISEWKLPHGGYLRQQRVATFWDLAEVLISDDLTHVAVIDQRGRKHRLAVDGKEGPEYDKATFLEHNGPCFGPGGMPLLYAGASEGRWRLVTNGRPGPECDAWLDQTACGPARTGIAYVAVEIARKAFVAVDGQAGPVCDDVSCPVLSPDRKRIACVVCRGRGQGRKQIPVIDGNEGPEYDEIAPDTLAFSPDGRRIAYAARTGQTWRVVLDGQPGPQFDRIGEGPILFMADGKRVAYAALAGPKWLVVSGGPPGAGCDEIADLISIDGGRHVAYAARQGARWRAVVGGQASAEYDQIGLTGQDRFWVSPDGGRVAYAARLAQKWQVVADGQAGPECNEVRADSAIAPFSPDGKHTACIARTGTEWSVVIDGQPGPSWDEIGRGSFEFSDDAARTAYAARRDKKWLMVIDGRAGKECDEVDASSPVFTSGGKRAAYLARRGDTWRVVVNGEDGPTYDDVAQLVYSPDGRRMAYVATSMPKEKEEDWLHAGQQVVLDGKAGPWYGRIGATMFSCTVKAEHGLYAEWLAHDRSAMGKGKRGRNYDSMHYPVFSPDGEHFAYMAQESGQDRVFRVVLDGTPGPRCDTVGVPTFSPDGKHLAYPASVAAGDKDKACVVIDGQLGLPYDEVQFPEGPGASCFSPDSRHVVYAARKGTAWCAVVDGKEGPPCDAFFRPGSETSYGRAAAYASWRSVLWYGEKNFQYAPDYRTPDFRPLFFGADGSRAAYVGIVQTRARTAVVVDGQAGPQYDQVTKPAVSPDGRRIGYIACRDAGQGRKFLAVIDGREGPECDEIPSGGGRDWRDWDPFGPDSARTAYLARIGQKWHAVIDGQSGPEYDVIKPAGVGPWGGFFSRDGKRIAYFSKRDGKWRAVIDGREGPEFDQMAGDFLPLVFSPDNKRVAYVAQWGQGPGSKFRAVIDGQLGPEYDAGWVAGVEFSPDSRRTAYVGKRGEKKFVVLDGKELAPHDAVDGIRLAFSPDSRRLAYTAYRGQKDDRKAHLVVDGQEGPEHGDNIWDTFFSPDSKHVAYIAINGRWQDSAHTEQMVVDGKEGPVVSRVERPHLNGVLWSSDSQRLAYVAVLPAGTKAVVADGIPGPPYTWVSGLEFSPDGKHLAYVARKDWSKCVLVRDGQAGPVFDEIETPWHDHLFSPDGRHIAYKVRQGGKHAVVLDDQVGPAFDSVLCHWFHMWPWGLHEELRWAARTPRFLPGGTVQYPAVRIGKPNELYIVKQGPAADPGPTAPR